MKKRIMSSLKLSLIIGGCIYAFSLIEHPPYAPLAFLIAFVLTFMCCFSLNI